MDEKVGVGITIQSTHIKGTKSYNYPIKPIIIFEAFVTRDEMGVRLLTIQWHIGHKGLLISILIQRIIIAFH